MSLHLSRLSHRFPEKKKCIKSLLKACHVVRLTDVQMHHLCEKILATPKLLDDFSDARKMSKEQAEAYILSCVPTTPLPPRRERQRRGLLGFLPLWLAEKLVS